MRKLLLTFKFMTGLVLAIGLLPAIAAPLAASSVSLKQNSVIEGNTIKLGDVFNGLDDASEKVLGPAPRPGHDMVLNARTLLRIAVAMDLPWRPASNADYVVLSRAGSAIGQETVVSALKERLVKDSMQGNYTFSFATPLPEVVLPADIPAQAEVTDMKIQPDGKTFEATLAAPSDENPVQTFRLRGVMHRLVSVPVLVESLTKGAIIGKRDIQMIEMREHSLKDEMIMSQDALIGMTPRRLIVAGQPVTRADIEAPRTVERGDLVTMIFQQGGMTLTAQGKAMEHGATGDTIRVTNTSSNKTLEALVTASKEVTVKSF